MIYYDALTYGNATQNADGTWNPPPVLSSSSGEWGSFRIEVGAQWDCYGTAYAAAGSVATLVTAGTDVTTINDTPTIIQSLSFAEPYGETNGLLTLPRLTPWDDPSAIGIDDTANVDIYRVLPAALADAMGTAEVPYWHGHVTSLEYADGPGITTGLSLQLEGALYGETRVRAHQPFMRDLADDIGTWLGRALSPLSYARPLPPYERFSFQAATTGIEVRVRGSRGQSVLDYLDELLALAKDDAEGTWTIQRAYQTLGGYNVPRARHYVCAEKDVDANGTYGYLDVRAGGYGVAYSLSKDAIETPTAIYGEGVHPTDSSDLSGSRWRNAVYPMLTGTAPAYPDRLVGSDYPITEGDTDADFTTDVVTQVQAQLRAGGWPDVRITGTWDADTTTALNALYDEAPGHAETGEIADDDDWDLIFNTSTGTTDLNAGFFLPLADTNRYYDYAADGDVIGVSNSYDALVLRVEQTISYGTGVTKARARKNAKRLARQAPEIVGTIALRSDVIDDAGSPLSRLDIRPGSWLSIDTHGGIDLHVAGVTVSDEGATVALTVSTDADDLLSLSERIKRKQDAKSDPARSFYNQRTATTRPFRSAVGWDAESGAGMFEGTRAFQAAGSAWAVQRIIGAQYGSIASLRVDVDPPAPYCFAVFGGSVAGTALDALIPNPLAAVGTADGSYPSWWQHPDNEDQLTEWGFIEAWGSFGEAAGYYPGAQSLGTAVAAGSVTGALEDAGSWTFASLDPPFLWVAAWVDTAGTPTVSGRMRIVVEE